MKTKSSLFSTIFLAALLAVIDAQAGTLDDIGFTDLKLELGNALPDGSSITVTQVEAPVSGACVPDQASVQFTSKFFNDNTTVCTGISNHATAVASRFYGNTVSSVSAVGTIDLFETNNWLSTGFLNTGANGLLTNSIATSATRLVNHSWVANAPDWDAEILRRTDFLIEVDEFIHVAGIGSDTTTQVLLTNSFNAIVVGISAGTGTTGTATIVTNQVNDATYVSGRAKPDVVAPETAGSFSAGRVSSAAVLLMDYAHTNILLSNGSTTNRNGATIYNAERSETIKALLMAGADRETVGNTNPTFDIDPDPAIITRVPVDITDYRATGKQTSNGLDTRFGAGQINLSNSYHILAAGEQDSAEDSGTTIANVGFDYDPSFGGLNSSNPAATYSFSTSAIGGQKIKASLVWNLDVLTKTTDNFHNLDLQLIDVTGSNAIVVSSTSIIDNTENIWFDLLSNRDYQLKVIPGSGQGTFDWDYALAWQIVVPGVTVVETSGSTTTAEDGTTDTFTIVLDGPPAGDVVINLTSSDLSEATVSPSSITFTSSNWSTLRVVTVTGVNDNVDDGNKSYNIDFTVSSAIDTNYDAMIFPGVSASNTDDDATFSFTDQTNVALNTLMTSNTVVITGLLNSAAISITGGEYSINGGAYTSTNGNIKNTDSVTVQATSSVTGSTSVNTILTIGDVNNTFTVTTEVDTDGDGVGDSVDAFPNDPTETVDSDGDGVGDNVDAFINNLAASVDADNDGLPDEWNVGCNTACQDISGLVLDVLLGDTDNDGVVNASDAFPNDPTETVDADGDGVGDNADVFPNDATETLDTDSDGIGDNADAFPNNIAASVDVDNDGKPDEWNASCDTTCQVSSGLTLDATTDVATGTSASSGGGSLGLMWLLFPFFITAGRRRVL